MQVPKRKPTVNAAGTARVGFREVGKFYMFTDKEERLQSLTEQWLQKIEMPYRSQQEVHRGNKVDLMLCLSQSNPEPWCVIELKTKLNPEKSSLKELASHFEQCVKYHMGTGLPVFLGPFFIPTMGIVDHLSGGEKSNQWSAAFSSFAGRMNVGMWWVNAQPGFEHDINYWYGFRMTMRGKVVAEWCPQSLHQHNKWPTERIDLVDFKGAASTTVMGQC